MQYTYPPCLRAKYATRLFSRGIYWLLLLLLFSQCKEKEKSKLPPPSPANGGLFLPGNFAAVVVADSLEGKARHIAVNDNGDIYVKARYGGADSSIIALRDTNNDGRAD